MNINYPAVFAQDKKMPDHAIVQFFEDMGAEAYDRYNASFEATKNNLQFLNMLILTDLPEDANILCVGIGTGADIIGLADIFPGWRFTGIEPAESMLKGCQKKLAEAGFSDRCELIHGYLSDFNTDSKFDAVICLFVMHFINDVTERNNMFSDFNKYLVNDGYLINAEISFDLNSDESPGLLEKWQALHRYAGANEDNVRNIPGLLREQLAVLHPDETRQLMKKNGFHNPIQFFQSFLVRAWYAQKNR
ncbi:MAG: class I SAM-dependent methyltransferase [Leptospiraceae bacterium]|nr:class I SAM-dependent methyltransferase [Leptospiraceae bacterium]